jgi:hypothetical protein
MPSADVSGFSDTKKFMPVPHKIYKHQIGFWC